MGGGSLPLLGAEDFVGMLWRGWRTGVAVTNNLFSSDLVAFPVDWPCDFGHRDGATRQLRWRGRCRMRPGLRVEALARTLATQFDIDTPTDVAVLAVRDGAWGAG